LGIFLVHKMVDKVAYRREGNKNILTLLYKPRGKC
jgi:anti-sigma regulatory factor (Ser/Thr protein kinase)